MKSPTSEARVDRRAGGQQQPDLFPRQPTPAPRTTETARGGYADFDFIPGPECEPRPDWVIPAELRLPTDPDEVTK